MHVIYSNYGKEVCSQSVLQMGWANDLQIFKQSILLDGYPAFSGYTLDVYHAFQGLTFE